MTQKTNLEVCEASGSCDGCGRNYEAGEKAIGCIESCCGGGCYRSLCFDCVRAAFEMAK